MSGAVHALGPAEAEALRAEFAARARPAAPPPQVLPFALGSDSFRATERLSGLERMGEKIARALRAAVEPMAQSRTLVTPAALETCRFDEWMEGLPFFVSVSHYRLRPLKGGMLVTIPPEFVAQLIERFYGGAPSTPGRSRKQEFSASEELLLARLLEKLVTILHEVWNEVTPVDMGLVARETSSAHIGFLRPDDLVVVQSFAVAPQDGDPAAISVVYPHAMLRPIEEQMAARVHDDAPAGNGQWRGQLAASLAQVTLPVRSVLARPTLSVAELLALKPGDVIPIQLAPRTPLLVAQRVVAEGVIGEQDGRAALLIEKVGQ